MRVLPQCRLTVTIIKVPVLLKLINSFNESLIKGQMGYLLKLEVAILELISEEKIKMRPEILSPPPGRVSLCNTGCLQIQGKLLPSDSQGQILQVWATTIIWLGTQGWPWTSDLPIPPLKRWDHRPLSLCKFHVTQALYWAIFTVREILYQGLMGSGETA